MAHPTQDPRPRPRPTPRPAMPPLPERRPISGLSREPQRDDNPAPEEPQLWGDRSLGCGCAIIIAAGAGVCALVGCALYYGIRAVV